jgi:CRP/FNR family transcriptional regulator, cyclic AMP receptor protein
VLLTNRRELPGPNSSSQFLDTALPVPPPHHRPVGDHANLTTGWSTSLIERVPSNAPGPVSPDLQPALRSQPQEVDPLYLFACYLEWEQQEEPSAAWELLAAARSSHAETRAQARAMLGTSRHFAFPGASSFAARQKRSSVLETDMNPPYGLEIIDNCAECTQAGQGFFCALSHDVLDSLSQVSHKSILPAGAILFVEGQAPRGMFIICSGKVNLSTTSREGKILILKTADAGEALGVSAAVSGMGYEATAETSTPCQVCFIDRRHFLDLMGSYGEIGMHTAQCLSRDFHSAYRDIHDLVLTRSSKGKLARLLLSHSQTEEGEDSETRIHASMTHEEMAMRIGASRETVTRLLSDLKRKQLIRLDGPTLVIRDRTALKALTV